MRCVCHKFGLPDMFFCVVSRWNMLGAVLSMTGKPELAVRAYRQALQPGALVDPSEDLSGIPKR